MSDETDNAQVLADAVVKRESYEKRTVVIICMAALFVIVACFSTLAYGLKKVNTIAEQNRVVVCNLHSGYEEQLKSTRKFAKANPNGGVLLGVKFTANDLRRSIQGLEKRLRDTEAAKC